MEQDPLNDIYAPIALKLAKQQLDKTKAAMVLGDQEAALNAFDAALNYVVENMIQSGREIPDNILQDYCERIGYDYDELRVRIPNII